MMQPSSLLLVDADTRSLETLTFGFEREGCQVSGTPDPGRAAQLARAASPELAVVAMRASDRPALDLLDLIGSLQGASAKDLPIVALGPPALRSEALAAGAADFLPLPIFLRDVISVGRLRALESKLQSKTAGRGKSDQKTGKKTAGQSEPPDELQMRLSEFFGLFYLLRAMAASERSGVLLLTRGNRRAELRVHQGAVVSANVGALQGLPALHHVLLWEEAALSLTRRPIPQRSQLHLSAQEVLDECERFLRDFAHAVRDLGAPRTLYVPAAAPETALPGLQPSQVTPLLRLFDGHRVLSDVIEESPFRIFDTVRMIRRLRDGGALAARPDGLVREPGDRRTPLPSASTRTSPGSSPSQRHNGSQKSMLAEWAMVPDQRGVVGNRRSTSRRLRPIGGPLGASVTTPVAAPIPLTTRKGASASGEIPAIKRKLTPARATDLAIAPTVQVRLDATGMPLSAPLAPSELGPLAPSELGPLAGEKTPPPVRARGNSGRHAPAEEAPPPRIRRSGSGRQVPLDEAPPPKAERRGSDRHAPLEEAPPPKAERGGSDRHAPLEEAPPPKAERGGSGRHAPLEEAPPPKAERGGSGRHASLEEAPPPKVELTSRPRRITGGVPGSAPDAFDAIEADFFAREADLYKREALETFDDLDPTGASPTGRRPRKK
jgi:DNA-binding response OmpR family regulator